MIYISWWQLIADKLNAWGIKLVKLTPNLLLALLVIAVFFLIARTSRRWTYRLIIRITKRPSISGLFSTVASTIFVLIGIFIALDILQLDKAVSSLLAGAGIIGLALGFAFQDLSANFISGVFIAFRKPFEVGHTVETNGYIGNIEEIHLRTTTIRTFQGLHLMIPNREIFQKAMINHSLSIDRRVELEFSLNISTNPDKAIKSAMDAIQKMDCVIKEKQIEIYFIGWHENALRMAVWFWINNHQPPGFMFAKHEAIVNIMKSFAENEIHMIVPVSIDRITAKIQQV